MTDVTYVTNVSSFKSNTANVNSFLSMIFTCLVVNKAFAIVKLVYTSFVLAKRTFLLLKIRKNIFGTTFILALANTKVC